MTQVETPPGWPGGATLAAALNQHCVCRSIDRRRLQQELERDPRLAGMMHEIAQTRPHLFADTMVFVSRAQIEAITRTVAAIERVVGLPGWLNSVNATAPPIAGPHHGPRGVLMGYDFHLGDEHPQLIEINTNAGGAMLALALTRAQQACCAAFEPLMTTPTPIAQTETEWLQMFRQEWALQRQAPLQHIVIVDEAPESQYLYPEFRLFQNLFQDAGYAAQIADPHALRWDGKRLWLDGTPVDMIYNRLTDFYFNTPATAALRAAYTAGAVVVTPHPHAHARYADKRHLVRLSNDAWLRDIGLDASTRATLASSVPLTHHVAAAEADALWGARKGYFFKPANGYGSRAAYRGDKLTRRVWNEILEGDYVAQRFAPPGARQIQHQGENKPLKFDMRAYTYAGRIQLFAARLYSGQTTNFRTPGGGFAPVFVTPR